MVTKEIIDYVKAQRAMGKNDETIKQNLLTGGWSLTDIQEAFSASSVPIPHAPTPLQSTVPELGPIYSNQTLKTPLSFSSSRGEKKLFIIPLLVVIVILVSGAGVYLYNNKFVNPQSSINNSSVDNSEAVITAADEVQMKKAIFDLAVSLKALDIIAYLNAINAQDRVKYAQYTDKGLLRDLQKDYFDSLGKAYPINIISIQEPISQQLSSLSAGRVAEVKFTVNGVNRGFDFVKEDGEWRFIQSFDKYDFSKSGQSSSNTNIVATPTVCAGNNYKMAFVLVARNQTEVTVAIVNKLTAIKNAFAKDFSTATSGLAKMDTSYKVVSIVNDGTLIKDEDSYIYPDRVMKKFYENNPDNYDFISIYPTFNDFNQINGQETHETVQNNIRGIYTNGRGGLTDKTTQYGSKGRLLGINMMPPIDRVQSPETDEWRSGGLLHETGHQWCCYVGDDFARGEDGAELEIIQQGMHFYRGLASPSRAGDPMDSDYWTSNGDGTFRRNNQVGVTKYHPFQLYFMGLLSKSEYSTKYKVYDAGIVGKDFNENKAKLYKEVSVNDIIKFAGERQCVSS